MKPLEDAIILYYNRVNYRFSLMVRDANTAEDLSQEVFARLCNRLRDGSCIDNLWAFIAGIMQNVWLEHLRSATKSSLQLSKVEQIEEVVESKSRSSVESVEFEELRKRMQKCLHDLDVEEQAIIVGLYYFEMTGDELAKWLGRPRKTLLYRHERAMKKLRSLALKNGLKP